MTRTKSRQRIVSSRTLVVAALAVLAGGALRIALAQPVTLPPSPASPPPIAHGATIQPLPLPDPADYPPDPPPQRPIVLPSFGPQ